MEIAAGDGTLSRFLRDEGVAVTATDDFSWQQHVDYDPEQVDRLDARTSLDRFAPEVVVCSWPPPGNSFEKRVFATGSVDTYVVIVSRSDQDAGDWAAYRDRFVEFIESLFRGWEWVTVGLVFILFPPGANSKDEVAAGQELQGRRAFCGESRIAIALSEHQRADPHAGESTGGVCQLRHALEIGPVSELKVIDEPGGQSVCRGRGQE